ncbi:Uncharacterized protein HZ326_19537 [Fusarium oxysporum f. sp. albedinis]|nr:Uncharacterized protein HZ326_19537 [Fusarium oxysporum f. sp. albedinis]
MDAAIQVECRYACCLPWAQVSTFTLASMFERRGRLQITAEHQPDLTHTGPSSVTMVHFAPVPRTIGSCHTHLLCSPLRATHSQSAWQIGSDRLEARRPDNLHMPGLLEGLAAKLTITHRPSPGQQVSKCPEDQQAKYT